MKPVDLSKEYAFGGLQKVGDLFSFLVGPAFNIAAIAVTFYFIIGGYKYIRSEGDKTEIAEAKEMITRALIGFVILMLVLFTMQFLPVFFGLKGFRII